VPCRPRRPIWGKVVRHGGHTSLTIQEKLGQVVLVPKCGELDPQGGKVVWPGESGNGGSLVLRRTLRSTKKGTSGFAGTRGDGESYVDRFGVKNIQAKQEGGGGKDRGATPRASHDSRKEGL